MKNVMQLVTLRDVDNEEIRDLLEKEYEDKLRGCDNYFRYYPNDDSFDKTEGATKKINDWLLADGFTIDSNDGFFHLLIRWDW